MTQPPHGSYAPSGTYEDILSILARAEERRYLRTGAVIPEKTSLARCLLQPVFHLLGMVVHATTSVLPGAPFEKVQDRCFRLAGDNETVPFESGAAALVQARSLCEEVERSTGKRPALLVMMSHPPVTPETLTMNVEMTRQILMAVSVIRGRFARGKFVVAVDSYALDLLPLSSEGLYAGFMSTAHLGFDRLSHSRIGPSRLLLGFSSWTRIPWRITSILARGGEVGIVLAGGIPNTARVLYTVREFLSRVRRGRGAGVAPKDFLRRLAKEDPDFEAFRGSGLAREPFLRSAWRSVEAWLSARMVGEWPKEDPAALEELSSGRVSRRLRDDLGAVARSLGIPEPAFQEDLRGLETEFARETPYRQRFFRFIASRVVSRGRPVVLVPLRHWMDKGEGGKVSVRLEWGSPAALLDYRKGTVTTRGAGPSEPAKSVPLDEFARSFVTVHYP
ncbi:MAG: hypothetical protein HY078_10930 [Elusimicrobia bacterium]|nr:hypothetical protein [Elusimicrobiota bacterium]